MNENNVSMRDKLVEIVICKMRYYFNLADYYELTINNNELSSCFTQVGLAWNELYDYLCNPDIFDAAYKDCRAENDKFYTEPAD